MARAVTRIDTYVGNDEGFAPWLFGICRHVVADTQRQTYRPLPPGLLRADVDGPGPAEAVLDAEEQALVRAAFARLDPDERELLELRVVGGMSSAEVAAALGKAPGTVRMAQMRALGRLRTFLEEASRVG
jgi:RNA polymerase sigma-70 factor (ECF subfamily)